jgi:hypothetical protein
MPGFTYEEQLDIERDDLRKALERAVREARHSDHCYVRQGSSPCTCWKAQAREALARTA